MKATIDSVVAALATTQHGLITWVQALELGLTARQIEYRVTAGYWEHVMPGLYRIAGSADTWHQRLLAACLSLEAVASHRSGAGLHRARGFVSGMVEITVPRWDRQERRGIYI